MNKKLTQLVPVCIIAAVLLLGLVTYFMVKQKAADLSGTSSQMEQDSAELKQQQEKYTQLEIQLEQDNKKLQSIKPIYKNTNGSSDNLSMFGNMFEGIVNQAQSDGLLIRSIEYSMNPESDPLYALKTNLYNVCELKFFFVGTYPQLLKYLADINEKFEYLTYISKMNVTAFSGNTDYLLINMSITLYSQKSDEEARLIIDENNSSDGKKSKKKSKKKSESD